LAAHAYKHPVNACDVVEKANLVTYRTQLDKWRAWCVSDDENSLQSQFSSMFWLDATFRLINETRKTSDSNFASFSGIIAETLDAGYVAGQAMAIRRLVDKRPDVISLSRVARDVEAHLSLITREVFVCSDGIPYDHEAAKDAQFAELMRHPPGTVIYGDPSADLSRRAHEVFDELSRVPPEARARTDRISPEVLAALEVRIRDCGAKAIVGAANKYLFHAADANSRKQSAKNLEVTLAQITDVHAKLAQIGNFISGKLLWEGPCALGVATAQFDVLDRLDRPFVDAERRVELQDWWARHSNESRRLSYDTLVL
jgi:hypothetical protein